MNRFVLIPPVSCALQAALNIDQELIIWRGSWPAGVLVEGQQRI